MVQKVAKWPDLVKCFAPWQIHKFKIWGKIMKVGDTVSRKCDAIFVLILEKIEILWKWLQKWVFCTGNWTLVKEMSFWRPSLVKEASNLSEIRCFPHDFWSIMNNIVTRTYFFHKTMSQLAFQTKFGFEMEVSFTNN